MAPEIPTASMIQKVALPCDTTNPPTIMPVSPGTTSPTPIELSPAASAPTAA